MLDYRVRVTIDVRSGRSCCNSFASEPKCGSLRKQALVPVLLMALKHREAFMAQKRFEAGSFR